MPTNEQLDKLIHEKVMGQPVDVPCDGYAKGGIQRDYNDPLNKTSILGIWHCSFCGYLGSGPTQPHNIPDEIPAYSTDLNEAWKVFLHMLGGYWNEKDKWNERHNLGFYEFATALLGDDDWIYSDEVFPGRDIFPIVSRWTPEKIVLAALKAYGVEIESDHAS